MRPLKTILGIERLETARGELKTGLSPVELFTVFASEPGASLLLSPGSFPEERYSYISLYPFMEITSLGRKTFLRTGENSVTSDKDIFDVLDELVESLSPVHTDENGPHFRAGYVGYFSYDLKDVIERHIEKAKKDLTLPLAHLYLPRIVLAHDKTRESWEIFSTFPEGDKKYVLSLIKEIGRRAETAARESVSLSPLPPLGDIRSNFTAEEYMRATERVLDHIRAGDIYQACLSQRFSCDIKGGAFPIFRHMDRINPAPFSAYLNFPEVKVLSSSPELFLKCTGNLLQTRPMKGTRRRGAEEKEDLALKEELLKSGKDEAELSMIVDLERNDLGKFSLPGTVKVEAHRLIKSYPTVHQAISVITGEKDPSTGPGRMLKHMFPGGSISGCPKIRAMDIIENLEPVKRNIYTGAIGYISLHRTAELNIAIRTMIKTSGRLFFQTGGGIVAGSDPECEYRETLDKAEAVFRCLGKGGAKLMT